MLAGRLRSADKITITLLPAGQTRKLASWFLLFYVCVWQGPPFFVGRFGSGKKTVTSLGAVINFSSAASMGSSYRPSGRLAELYLCKSWFFAPSLYILSRVIEVCAFRVTHVLYYFICFDWFCCRYRYQIQDRVLISFSWLSFLTYARPCHFCFLVVFVNERYTLPVPQNNLCNCACWFVLKGHVCINAKMWLSIRIGARIVRWTVATWQIWI